MSLRSWFPLLVALFLVLPGVARAERPVEDDVRELMRLTGVEAQLRDMGTQMKQSMVVIAPQVPAALWDEMFSESSISTLIDRMVPIYVQEIPREDLKALLDFYRSPVGQRFAAKLPVLQRRGMEVGQQWGMEIGMRVAMKQEGAKP